MIIYIHGFASCGISSKANILKQELKEFGEVISPSLSYVPSLAVDTLEQIISSYEKNENVYLVGTSLGGYYATYLADKFDIPAVLINPAVDPIITLKQYLPNTINHFDQSSFEWNQTHIKQLQKYDVQNIKSDMYLLLVQKDDEQLDYRKAVNKFSKVKQIIEDGGNHRFDGIERYINEISEFLKSKTR